MAGYESYIRIISFLAESTICSPLVFGYYRGNGKFAQANLLIACSQGVIPVAALFFIGSLKPVLEVIAAGTFLVSFLFSLPIIKMVLTHRKGIRLVTPLKELLRYGLARVPGDISMAGILALPAFLTSNLFGIKEAGFVAFGISMVSMVGAIFQPVGLITLPKLSSILSEGRHDEARTIMQKTIKYTAIISIVVTFALFLSAKYVVHYWLGPQFDEATGVVRLAKLAAVPNALFIALRSSIDAANIKAVNASNQYKALFVSAIAYFMVEAGHLSPSGIPLSFLMGMAVLSFLTLKVSFSTYGLNLQMLLVRIRQ